MSTTSTIRIFTVEAGFDFSVTLAIDTSVMTFALAEEINNFWSGQEEVLAASNGDPIQAVARRAAPYIMYATMDGKNSIGAAEHLSQQEGWPEIHGITVKDFDMPDFEAAYLDVKEVQPS